LDRATRQPSAHTLKAYRQDFTAAADLLTSGSPADVALIDITKETMRAAFAAYACTHEPASIRRCWSTWNVLCDFLYTAELIPANPMPFVGRPKAAKTLPRSLPPLAVAALLEVVGRDHDSPRRTDWPERDLALMRTGLLAGLRADELRRADVGDIRTGADGGAVLHVRGKGSKDRAVPTVNTVAAGRGATPGYDGLGGTPAPVASESARLTLFLSTPPARHLTGQTLHVGHGALANFG
jgi:integrase/recombinase XerC